MQHQGKMHPDIFLLITLLVICSQHFGNLEEVCKKLAYFSDC